MSVFSDAIEHVDGFRVAGVHCGLKKNDKLDYALIVSDSDCVAAGVFTTNMVKAASVIVNSQLLKEDNEHIRAVSVNTGIANACTGQEGIDNNITAASYVAEKIGCDRKQVLVLSTGVIGPQLAMEKIRKGVDLANGGLGDHWRDAATAIMTTDTQPKLASVDVTTTGGGHYRITGISKGSGMIAPNMATMLGVIVTDAQLKSDMAQTALKSAADVSYNCIVVDGDMSTNDTVFLLANGASGTAIESAEDYAQFQDALTQVCIQLAQGIVRDGEGATKFITISITGTPDTQAARQIANKIATSPLVKTAFFGSDANWGRIIVAAGQAGIALNPETMKLSIAKGEDVNQDGLLLFDGGMPTGYQEADAAAIMAAESIMIHLDCGAGDGLAVVWTCDLSYDYVKINGDYRT